MQTSNATTNSTGLKMAMPTDNARVHSDESIRLLERSLGTTRGRITASDASAVTGLPLEQVRDALDVLMNRYTCRLQVTESGEVLFDFGATLRRRGEKTLRERMQAMGALMWKAFTFGFKIWITIMLVVYFVLFLVLLLVLLFGGKDSKKSIKLDWVGDLLADIFWISSRNMVIVDAMDGGGYRHRAYRQKQRRGADAEPKKRLVQSVYDFVFGPPRPTYDPLADEKEVAAWLRAQRGLLTMTELVALAGWTYDEASERMASYLTRFKGDATITDDGVLTGDFHRMLARGDGDIEVGKVELFWDEYEAPYEMTGNSGGRNAVIIGMNAFNLLFSAVIVFSSGFRAELGTVLGEVGVSGGVLLTLLGVIPVLFSLLFFTVPLLRLLPTRRREAQRRRRNERRRVLRHVFARRGAATSLAEYAADLRADQAHALGDDALRRILEDLLPRYGGRSDLAEDGTVLYIFDRIAHETEAAARVRAERDGSFALGDVIFDSGGALPAP
ncbi:MAG: hypothetical protein RBU27_03830 [Bacteroidota bacterium]|nr:hypothetical protein [Bacteroidota bacterium]